MAGGGTVVLGGLVVAGAWVLYHCGQPRGAVYVSLGLTLFLTAAPAACLWWRAAQAP